MHGGPQTSRQDYHQQKDVRQERDHVHAVVHPKLVFKVLWKVKGYVLDETKNEWVHAGERDVAEKEGKKKKLTKN